MTTYNINSLDQIVYAIGQNDGIAILEDSDPTDNTINISVVNKNKIVGMFNWEIDKTYHKQTKECQQALSDSLSALGLTSK